MWIDYRKPSSETFSYEGQIKRFNEFSAKKILLSIGSKQIHTYEFAYNPNSERSGFGPYLEAIWTKDSWIFNATTMDSSNKKNNELKVEMLKQILSTMEFIKK